MRRLSLVSLLILLSSCGEGDYGYSLSDIKATSVVVVSSLSNILDEESGAGFQFSKRSLCLDRAGVQSCTNGRKSITYNGCEATSDVLLTGTVSLSYSDNSCSLGSLNNNVVRSFDLIRNNYDGSRDQVYSNQKTDYLDNVYGGGSLITAQGGNSYSLQILGKHADKTRSSGFEGYETSFRTTTNISVTSTSSDLRRDGRSLSGGIVELAHNRLKVLTTYTIANLTYSSGCCHPISGTINVSLSEGASGSGQIQFSNSCGSAALTMGDVTETMVIGDCNY